MNTNTAKGINRQAAADSLNLLLPAVHPLKQQLSSDGSFKRPV